LRSKQENYANNLEGRFLVRVNSWLTGIPEVALVVLVRKKQPEIQYLWTSISEKQREEYGRLVTTTIEQIEAAQFPSHSGIRFPQNGSGTLFQ
jgi:hypothetical protein